MATADRDLAQVIEMLGHQCEQATAEQFAMRLTNAVLVASYIEKRFRDRYPEEYVTWLATQTTR